MTRSRPATFAAVLVAGFVSSSTLQAQFTVPAFMVPKIPNLTPTLPANSPTIPNSNAATFPNSPNGASFGIILGGPSLTTPMIPNATKPTVPQTSTTSTGTTSTSSTGTTTSVSTTASTGTTSKTSKPDTDNRSFRLIIGGDQKANSSSPSPASNTTGTASGSSTTGTSTASYGTTPATSTELSNLSLITSLAAVQSTIQGVRTELAADGVPPNQIDRLLLQIITQGNDLNSGTTGQTNSMWSGLHQHSRVSPAGSANGGSNGSTGHTSPAGGSTRIGTATGMASGGRATTPMTKPTTKPTATHPQQTKTTGNTNR